ncbi:MAG: DUF2075 domain-containing protein [Methanobacteriaceae archaeon]|nr:DUF2075 domain-containing protein [Methanobacteriaceae archaeon]
MESIKTFKFNESSISDMATYRHCKNWPVVYMIENGREMYIGETTSAYSRTKQHLKDTRRKDLNKIHLVIDDEYNKSAALDIESSLIEYIAADGTFSLQNGNLGLSNHNYYDREKYQAKFELLWESLKKKTLVKKELIQIRNSDLFKYSPYKALTEDQIIVAENIIDLMKMGERIPNIVSGAPGTGKTVLAVYLVKRLKESDDFNNLNIALVVPMTSLRKTLKKVFKNVKGLSSNMVIGPSQVVNKKYDILIVDEAHRLRRRVNLMPGQYATFDKINKSLGLDDGDELDWIINFSKYQVLFYDENQSIKPSDVKKKKFENINFYTHELTSQLRVKGGNDYIEFIDNLLNNQTIQKCYFKNYDFKIYNDIKEMVNDIKIKNKKHELSRLVAGYAWDWQTKEKKNINYDTDFDIEINGTKLTWNTTAADWVNSKNSINEVGCIHTIQGYDLNYVGVIIGPELSYDFSKREFIINKDLYKDKKGKNSIKNPKELEKYILNIYKVLLTRGILGTYVYVCDESLKKYLEESILINK